MTLSRADTTRRNLGTSPSPPRSQTDVVVSEIKAMIVRGELQPGGRLPVENDLAAALGVSRGSLREGVRALALLGVLETRQGDGTYVTALDASLLMAPLGFIVDLQSPGETGNLASVRRLLEVEAAARAALRIRPDEVAQAKGILDSMDDLVDEPEALDLERSMSVDIAFHGVIAHAAGNPVLEALIEAFSNRTIRARTWRALTEQGVWQRTHREHREILHAVASGDPDRARLAMSIHLIKVEEFIREHPIAQSDLLGAPAVTSDPGTSSLQEQLDDGQRDVGSPHRKG